MPLTPEEANRIAERLERQVLREEEVARIKRKLDAAEREEQRRDPFDSRWFEKKRQERIAYLREAWARDRKVKTGAKKTEGPTVKRRSTPLSDKSPESKVDPITFQKTRHGRVLVWKRIP
jgi:hypothetical protein